MSQRASLPIAAAALGAVLLSGCADTPSPAATASPGAAAPAVSPNAATVPSCRLPLTGLGDSASAGGFVSVAAGSTALDPSSQMADTTSGHLVHTTRASPVLVGDSLRPYYDRAIGRWLPADFRHMAPDGLRYAYTEIPMPNGSQAPPDHSAIHIVDARSGADVVAHSGDWFTVMEWRPEGIWLTRHQFQADGSSGLWLMNPQDHSIRQVDGSQRMWELVGSGAAWAGDLDPADPHPPGMKFPSDRVLRLDLASGARTYWAEAKGKAVVPVGFTADGQLLVWTWDASAQSLWIYSGPASGSQLYTRAGQPELEVMTDAHGIWVLDDHTLLLATPGGGSAAKVATVAPGGSPEFTGGCH